MGVHRSLYKVAHRVLGPLYRRGQLAAHGAFGLGGRRPRRTGRALVSYISDYVRYVTAETSGRVWEMPWEEADSIHAALCQGRFAAHSNNWECAQVVHQLVDRGFAVDCIYDRSGYLVDDLSRYDVILDEWSNLPQWAATNPQARKWFYATTSHWRYCNASELQRLDWLFRRRGVDLAATRQLPPLLGPQDADMVTFFGNDYTAEQYGIHRPKLRKVDVSTSVQSPAFPPKDWLSARRRFLFFGSTGWVHRGLDLVLEAFLGTDIELAICGADDGFLRVYGDDIGRCRNIRYLGFIYPTSDRFCDLVQTTCTVVYPSAAEGCSTSVLQCMQFGLIPLVTEATGLDVHSFWPALMGATDRDLIDDIRRRCLEVADMAPSQLEALSRACWSYTREHHTRDAYRTSLGSALDEFLPR